jgi:hypothetical protein
MRLASSWALDKKLSALSPDISLRACGHDFIFYELSRARESGF